MKKTLVALAVLAAAGSAQAIELYNQDKVTVNFTGDVEVRYKQDVTDGAEFKQEISDADFGFDTRYAVNDEFQVGAYWEFAGANDEKRAKVGDVYMGLYSSNFGAIKFGRLATQIDDAGIGSDKAFGLNSFVQDANLSFDEAVRYDLDKGAFYGGLGFVQNKGLHNASADKDSTIFDAKLGGRVAGFDFTGFYGQFDAKDAAGNKATLMALEARYALEMANIELGYYNNKDENNAGDSTDNTFGIAADYTVNAITFAAGYSMTKYDDEITLTNADLTTEKYDTVNNWFINAAYSFAPSTEAYIEVGSNDGFSNVGTDAVKEYKQNGTGVAIGLKADF